MVSQLYINATTLDNANLIPLLDRIKIWQKKFVIVWIATNQFIRENKITGEVITVPRLASLDNPLQLIALGLLRNFISIPVAFSKVENESTFFSISSTLDLCILPFFLKLFKKEITWCVVFDNWVFRRPEYGMRNLFARIFFLMSLRLLKKADRIFYISPELGRMLKRDGFSAKQLVASTNGVEKSLIRKTYQRRFTKASLKKEKYKYDCIYVGRIHPEKGILDLISLTKRLVEKDQNFKLALVGNGNSDFYHHVSEKIKTENLEKNVFLLGKKTGAEKFALFLHSKLFLCLSHHESFGLALFEAVCSGLPAVAYDLNEFKKIYIHQEVNFVKLGEPTMLEKKITSILYSKRYLNKKGQNLLKNFSSWDNIAQKEATYFNA